MVAGWSTGSIQKYGWLAVLVFVCVFVLVATRFYVGAPFGWFKGAEARVEVISSPSGAWVFVDDMGNQRGRTPQTITVAPGKHTIIVRQPGYEKWMGEIVVAAGETQTISAELKSIEGYHTPTTLSQEEIETHRPQTTTTTQGGQQATTTVLEVTLPLVTSTTLEVGVVEGASGPRILGYIVEFFEEPVLAARARNLKEIEGKEDRLKKSGLGVNDVSALQAEISSLKRKLPEALAAQKAKVFSEQENKLKVLEEKLPKLKDSKSVKRRFSTVFNGVSLDISAEEAEALRKLPGVKGVYPNYEVHATLMDSVPLIEADKVWRLQITLNNHVRGQNITIAIIDTGIDYTHMDLGGCIGPSCKVVGGFDFVNNDSNPMDDVGHGTHCAGITAGNGALKGVAPDARLVAFKVLDSSGSGSEDNVISAVERSYDLDNDGKVYGVDPEETNPEDIVDVISISLGAQCSSYDPSCGPDDPASRAVDTAVDNGVVAVVAAGNCGPEGGFNCIRRGSQTIESPATARKAITVGATDKQDAIAGFSSRGPVVLPTETIIKPDVVAPGVGICSAEWDNAWSSFRCLDDRHVAISGTSMATPHVAGAAALLKQAHPDWSPQDIKTALMETAVDLSLDIDTQGAGKVNVSAAVRFNSTVNFLEELCEVTGDEDGDNLSDCADAVDCPTGMLCNLQHTMFCNTAGICAPQEDCAASGDEDLDGLADCADVRDCPVGAFCDVPHTKICNTLGVCMPPEKCDLPGDEDGDGLADCRDTVDCPKGAICDSYNLRVCNASGECAQPAVVRMWKWISSSEDLFHDNQGGRDVSVAGDGSVYVVGRNYYYPRGSGNFGMRMWLLKFSPDGSLLWDRKLHKSGATIYSSPQASDINGVDVSVLPDGSIYTVSERINYLFDDTFFDCVVAKYDSECNLLWNLTCQRNSEGYNDMINNALVSDDGSIYVAGTTRPNGTYNMSILSAEYTPQGIISWRKKGTFNLNEVDSAYGISRDNVDGSLYVAASVHRYPTGESNATLDDLLLLKYASNGNLLWNQTPFEGIQDWGTDVAVAPDGSVYVLGGIDYGDYPVGLLLLKYTREGNLSWSRSYRGSGSGGGKSVSVAGDGSIYVLAKIYSYNYSDDLLLLKYDSKGNLLWNYTDNIDETGMVLDGWVEDIVVGSNGSIYVTGSANYPYANPFRSQNLLLIKYVDTYCAEGACNPTTTSTTTSTSTSTTTTTTTSTTTTSTTTSTTRTTTTSTTLPFCGGVWVNVSSQNRGVSGTRICNNAGYWNATKGIRCPQVGGDVVVFPLTYQGCGALSYADCFNFSTCNTTLPAPYVLWDKICCEQRMLGNLNITSSPTSASLYVDSVYRGLTPRLVVNLTAGYHPTTVSKTGYSSYSGNVYIQGGRTTYLSVILSTTVTYVTSSTLAGSLYVFSTPVNASLYVDNTFRGLTPRLVSGLAVGYHTVLVNRTGYLENRTTVYVNAGRTTNLNITLRRLP